MNIPEYITKEEVRHVCSAIGIRDWTALTEASYSDSYADLNTHRYSNAYTKNNSATEESTDAMAAAETLTQSMLAQRSALGKRIKNLRLKEI
jgi:hypothetical protein